MDISLFLPGVLAGFMGGYILGSIPFGLLLTRLAGLGDIRAIGSGNIGATNVLRTGRKDIALGTLLLDGLKGAAAVFVASHFSVYAGYAAALGAVVGHVFPVWLKFKGGKGVATGLGVLLALVPWVGLGVALIWAAMAKIFKISSLAALTGFALAPVMAGVLYGASAAGLVGAIAALIMAMHHANIKRLIAGTEPKIGQKS